MCKEKRNNEECAQKVDNRKSLLPAYLQNNDFTVELNYKLWVTKGSRFKAAERCKIQNDRYTKIIAYVSVYMIIINVINICKIPRLTIDDNYVTTITIGFSIILLVASQFIYAENYSVQAYQFHSCALDISKIYNQLRIAKTQEETNINDLTVQYESILSRCENHTEIDYNIFKTTKPTYFNLNTWDVVRIKIAFFVKCNLLYYFSMIGVPALYVLLAVCLNKQ